MPMRFTVSVAVEGVFLAAALALFGSGTATAAPTATEAEAFVAKAETDLAADSGGHVELPEADDLKSLAVALEIERMIREGRGEIAWPKDLPWSVPSA